MDSWYFLRQAYNRIPGLLKSFILLAIGGIIGNRMDWAFVHVGSLLRNAIQLTLREWFIVTTETFIIAVLGSYVLRLRGQLESMYKLSDLDLHAFRLLSELTETEGDEMPEAMAKLLKKFLEDIVDAFPSISRACLLTRQDDHLVPWSHKAVWVHAGMTDKHLEEMRAYVGNGSSPVLHEVLREAYLDLNRVQKGKVIWDLGQWVCPDNELHSISDPKRKPDYRSFIVIPLTWKLVDNDMECLGVLYLASMDQGYFELDETQALLFSLADRLVSTILIYESFDNDGEIDPYEY